MLPILQAIANTWSDIEKATGKYTHVGNMDYAEYSILAVGITNETGREEAATSI